MERYFCALELYTVTDVRRTMPSASPVKAAFHCSPRVINGPVKARQLTLFVIIIGGQLVLVQLSD